MMNARDSSSSEDENAARIKEAVWSFGPETQTPEDEWEKTQSKRLKVCDHEHDGNQLKTTPEFRCHVAKKLGAMLDSVICEVFRESPVSNPAPHEPTHDEADNGFRLFSTSLPGNWREEPKNATPPKRRPVPSSSESDNEMELRLKEAAVSISDLIPSLSTERREEKKGKNNGERNEESSEPQKKKKKKKKVVSEREEEESDLEDKVVGQIQSGVNNTQKKKKKKRRRKTDNEQKSDGGERVSLIGVRE